MCRRSCCGGGGGCGGFSFSSLIGLLLVGYIIKTHPDLLEKLMSGVSNGGSCPNTAATSDPFTSDPNLATNAPGETDGSATGMPDAPADGKNAATDAQNGVTAGVNEIPSASNGGADGSNLGTNDGSNGGGVTTPKSSNPLATEATHPADDATSAPLPTGTPPANPDAMDAATAVKYGLTKQVYMGAWNNTDKEYNHQYLDTRLDEFRALYAQTEMKDTYYRFTFTDQVRLAGFRQLGYDISKFIKLFFGVRQRIPFTVMLSPSQEDVYTSNTGGYFYALKSTDQDRRVDLACSSVPDEKTGATVPFYEYIGVDGRRYYTIDQSAVDTSVYKAQPTLLCYVFRFFRFYQGVA